MSRQLLSIVPTDEIIRAVREEIRSEFDRLEDRLTRQSEFKNRNFLSERQAVKYTSLSRSTLQRARRSGELKAAGNGRAIRYSVRQLDAFMLARTEVI